jgi:metal-sulfur cluster biosynthetic enzyme
MQENHTEDRTRAGEPARQEEKAGAATAAVEPGSSIPAEELEQLTADIVGALKTVYDPEIPADIYELGLIYKIDIDDDRNVAVEMTLTAPGCPVAGEMPIWVENAVTAWRLACFSSALPCLAKPPAVPVLCSPRRGGSRWPPVLVRRTHPADATD